MSNLSKSRLLSFRQCTKRLWLEIHRPDLREVSADAQARFAIGHQVGDIARKLYDPKGTGHLIDAQSEGFDAAFARTRELLKSDQPIFEAGFAANGALAFADIMLPTIKNRRSSWRMIEVKSSTSVKDYHRDDAAIQASVAIQSGAPLTSIALAHIDSGWTYPGGNNYQGLLVEEDLTEEAFGRGPEVADWISEAQAVARKRNEPEVRTGPHCNDPFECPFLAYCQGQQPQPTHPIDWLPGRFTGTLTAMIEKNGWTEMREIPDEYLNDRQRLVKAVTLSGNTHFDAEGARADLTPHQLPALFLDFETVQFTVPIWKGTRPYQQIPFQFSIHRVSGNGTLEHREFLDLSGNDPSKAFAEALVSECGETEPVFVYNAVFERGRISELAERFPRLKRELTQISKRIVDLLPVARKRYYHPDQEGRWSIKAVLPAIASDLRYDALDGVQDGGMAMNAYYEAISTDTSVERKRQVEAQLRDYCRLDTFAMVRLWQFFTGRPPTAP